MSEFFEGYININIYAGNMAAVRCINSGKTKIACFETKYSFVVSV